MAVVNILNQNVVFQSKIYFIDGPVYNAMFGHIRISFIKADRVSAGALLE